jgi:hypothetical protein
MKNELGEIRNNASEARLVVGAVALKGIKRKAKSKSEGGLRLRLFFKHLT